jgi:hypothetical protein
LLNFRTVSIVAIKGKEELLLFRNRKQPAGDKITKVTRESSKYFVLSYLKESIGAEIFTPKT